MIRTARAVIGFLVFTTPCFAQMGIQAAPQATAPEAPPTSVLKLPPQKLGSSPAPTFAKTPGYYTMPLEGDVPADRMPNYLRVSMSIDGGPVGNYLVDTGSTGIVVGAEELPHFDPNGEKGELTYSSSGRKEEGVWQTVTVTFPDAKYHGPDDGKPHVATAKVRVLAVTHLSCVNMGPNAAGCHPSDSPNPHMLGIGFGRGADRAKQPNNAFTSLSDMNGGPVRTGYIISHSGIQLGLTDDTAAGFDFQKLTPRTDAKPDNLAGFPRDWITAPGSFIVNGKKSPQGTVLIDTGLSNMMLATEGESKPGVVVDGTPITIVLPGGKYQYQFHVNDKSKAVPLKVNWVYPRSGTYVNTGLRALNLFDYLYDADGGYLGLRPKQ